MNPGPLDPLERQIEHTRRSLDRTLRDLKFRLSPGRQLPTLIVALGIAGALWWGISRIQRRNR